MKDTQDIESAAANEFDQWAQSGRGERMEAGHLPVTLPVLEALEFNAQSHVLDVGCGSGWLVRLCLERGAGRATGVDISPTMIQRAQAGAGEFAVASGERLPYADGTFSHILSVESLYYYADPLVALRELRRVAAPGAKLAVVIELFAESPVGEVWKRVLDVEVHNWSERRWAEAASQAGWAHSRTHRVPREPAPPREEFTPSPYWPDYETVVGYHTQGALAILGQAD